MAHEDCIEYLEQQHTPLVKELPELRRFTVSIPTAPEKAGYDEVAELRFRNAKDLDTATTSEAWQQTMADAECFIDIEKSIMITVEDNQIDHRPVPEFV